MEDKNKDSFLLDLPMFSKPIFIPHSFELVNEFESSILASSTLIPNKSELHTPSKVRVMTKETHAKSVVDKRFTSGYCMYLGRNLVTWRSKNQ